MSGSRLALVADDARLAGLLQQHLKKTLGQQALACSFATVREYLTRDAECLLVLAANPATDAESVLRLVQEVYLQKLGPVVLLSEGHVPEAHERFALLDPYLSSRLRWPDDAELLAQRLRERLGRGRPAPANGAETPDAVIRRRLLANTPSLLPLVERIGITAAHDVTVLLTGETGTGKTSLARLMHECSPRREGPFLAVPCGALPANLIESTFFGHVRGAFTGADRDKVGKFEAAGTGTLLLDEIDTLPLEQQAGLLRVIESGEFEPVGSNETRRCRARIIVASNWDLEEAVQQGKFRQDLYYRLNVMSFHLPPLRERVQDIAPLVRNLVARYAIKFRKQLFEISAQALEVLENFSWPGNIRQLENFLQQAVLMSSGPELRSEHLPEQVRSVCPPSGERTPAAPLNSLMRNREILERNVIQRALASNGYSRSRAADALGISRVTLYKKMKKYNLMRLPFSPSDA